MNARLTLIAHAATEAQRQAAFPIDEVIREPEIAKIASLHWIAPRAERIWSAPERRAQETCRNLGLAATVDDALRDCDFGSWRGRSMDAVQAQEPEGILAWLTDPSAAPHGGESIKGLIGRIGTWIDGHCGTGHTIAVTHPAVIRAVIVSSLRIPLQNFWRFDVAPLTLTDLRFSRDLWTLRCVGCELPPGNTRRAE